MALTAADAQAFARCMAAGGFAVFPADTVYGLACDPGAKEALQRIYLAKGRPMDKPSAVLFFRLALLWDAIPELEDAERAAAAALLPGPVTLLLPNRARRFGLACGPSPETVGVRVPALDDGLAPLGAVPSPVVQTSANLSGGPDPRTLGAVPEALRAAADLVLDAGARPGTPSTVVDLRDYAAAGTWAILRHGALSEAAVAEALARAG